jgi:hypothetical protein
MDIFQPIPGDSQHRASGKLSNTNERDLVSSDGIIIMDAISSLTPQQLRQAADIQERIVELQGELARLLGRPGQVSTASGSGKRKISAAGLARIREAQRRRWAKVHGQNGNPGRGHRPKSSMSAAARAAIAARMRARWAAAKKSGRNAL